VSEARSAQKMAEHTGRTQIWELDSPEFAPCSSLTDWVTLGKYLNLFELQFSLLQIRTHDLSESL
jgi:hypothetical protein